MKTEYRSCPICGDYDDVCTVRDAIWSDTHVTRTSGATIGWVDPNQTTTSYYTSVNSGELAGSLAYPGKPFSIIWLNIFLLFGVIVCWVLGYAGFLGETVPKMDSVMGVATTAFFGLIFSLILNGFTGLIYGAIAYFILFVATIPNRAQWKKDEEYYLDSDYCYHDNVVFDGEVALPPQEYVQYVFAK